MFVVRKLWQGGYPLIRSFWLFYVLGNIAVFILALILSAALLLLKAKPFAIILFSVLCTAYFLIASVGVWQSATRYPYTRWWPYSAKLIVAVMAARTVWVLVNGGAQLLVDRVME